jgi:hypothetical protein
VARADPRWPHCVGRRSARDIVQFSPVQVCETPISRTNWLAVPSCRLWPWGVSALYFGGVMVTTHHPIPPAMRTEWDQRIPPGRSSTIPRGNTCQHDVDRANTPNPSRPIGLHLHIHDASAGSTSVCASKSPSHSSSQPKHRESRKARP